MPPWPPAGSLPVLDAMTLLNGAAPVSAPCGCEMQLRSGRLSKPGRAEPGLVGGGCGVGADGEMGGAGGRRLRPCPWAFEGVYGDVQRVKILFNKKENALVQMADGNQAQLGKRPGWAGPGGGGGRSCLPSRVPGHMGAAVPSHEPPEWAQAARETHPHHALEAPERAAAPRGPGGPGPDQGLWQLAPAPLQEAGLQELPEYIPALSHAAPLQHPVSAGGGRARGRARALRGCPAASSCELLPFPECRSDTEVWQGLKLEPGDARGGIVGLGRVWFFGLGDALL